MAYNREYYEKNKASILEKQRAYRKLKPHIARKGCSTYYSKHKEERRAYHRAYRYDDIPRSLHTLAKARSRQLGLEFAISKEDIVVPDACPVLGIPFSLRGENRSAGPSLDRIDATKGYVPGNVMVISLRANQLKNNATIEQLEAIIKYMRGASK